MNYREKRIGVLPHPPNGGSYAFFVGYVSLCRNYPLPVLADLFVKGKNGETLLRESLHGRASHASEGSGHKYILHRVMPASGI